MSTDTALEELRALHGAYSGDDAMREALARALTLAVLHAWRDAARQDTLLRELRTLHGATPDDDAVQEWLARAQRRRE